MKHKTTYRQAGVDIGKAEGALARLKKRINSTHTAEVLGGVGLFGGFYDISGQALRHPVLVASTDGVGTKLKVAIRAGRHDTIGQDLVNHCCNDIAVGGARPLFFLDYFACGKLDPAVYHQVIGGLTTACLAAGIPLLGGETAEMPDLYHGVDYDLAGTIIGIVEKDEIIDGRAIVAGDCLVGVSGNGLHTNGYTLARRVLLDRFPLDEPLPQLSATLADELLRIHPNYYPLITALRRDYPLKGIAHVTGGGIEKNTARLLPRGLALQIDWRSWPVPAIFQLIQKTGNVPEADMRQAFNLGIGLVLVMDPDSAARLLQAQKALDFSIYPVGSVVSRKAAASGA